MPYLAHFGLKEHPFTLTPDVDYFFPTEEHANIINSVEFALRRDTGIIKVVGQVGTGKTLLCRLLIQKLVDTEAVAYINAPRANARSIVLDVCTEFGLDVGNDADAAYGALNRFLVDVHAQNRLAVVVVDEAQHLGREGLELVRLISNLETEKRKLLQIVMFGQTELDELLALPSLRQLNQRIAFALSTKPLSAVEAKAYINHRIRVSRRPGIEYDAFHPRAVDLLARSCGGVPRVINIIADKSLLAAFAGGSPIVKASHVTEALKESSALTKPVATEHVGWMHGLKRAASYVSAAIALAAIAIAVLAVLQVGDVRSTVRGWFGGKTASAPITPIAPQTQSAPAPATQPVQKATAPAPAPQPVQKATAPAPQPPAATSAPAAVEIPAAKPPEPAPVTKEAAAPTPAPAKSVPAQAAAPQAQAPADTAPAVAKQAQPATAPAAETLAASPTPAAVAAPAVAPAPTETAASPVADKPLSATAAPVAATATPVAATVIDPPPEKPATPKARRAYKARTNAPARKLDLPPATIAEPATASAAAPDANTH